MSEFVLGIDTNVLVRFLSADDPAQSEHAKALMTKPVSQPIYLSMLVLAEAFTVMTKVKKFPADAVLDSYRLLLRSPQLQVECPDMVARAVDDARATRAGFPDAIIALQNAEAGCTLTASFDIRACRLPAMGVVEDCL